MRLQAAPQTSGRKTKAEKRRLIARRVMLQRGTRFSAREWHPVLVERLLASRPVTKRREKYVDEKGKNRVRTVVEFGNPTFRNVINERGEHV